MCALSKEDLKQCSSQIRADREKWESENVEKKPVKISAKAKKRKRVRDIIEMNEEDKKFHNDFDYLAVD